MIQKIKIKNFQSHKNTEINFQKGVNVITGTSDCGKSSIIRAIKWVAYNKPRGEGFRSSWGGETSVTLDFGEIQITRLRGKENMYILHKEGEDSIFKAVQTDVPEEIQNIIKMGGINLQQQLDSPFLLSSSAGEVAQHFNKIAGLSQIDIGLKNIKAKIRKITTTKRYIEDTLISKKQDLKTYDFIKEMEEDIVKLENLENSLQNKQKEKEIITDIIRQLFILDTNKETCLSLVSLDDTLKKVFIYKEEKNRLISKEKRLKYISELFKKYKQKEKYFLILIKKEEKVKKLQKIFIQKKNLQKQEKHLSLILFAIKKEEKRKQKLQHIIKNESDIKQVLLIYTEKKKIKIIYKRLTEILVGINTVKNKMKAQQEKVSVLEKHFKNNFPDVCPLCGTTKVHKKL